MTLRFDLRPRAVIESSVRRFRYQRVVAAVLLLGFMTVTGVTLISGTLLSSSLKKERVRLEQTVHGSSLQNSRLAKEVQKLKAREKIFAGALDLLQKELPSLEFLGALEGALPQTVWLDKVGITAGHVKMSGNAYTENDIVTFARGLTNSTVVTYVGLPVTTRSRKNGHDVVRFSLDCGIRDLQELGELSLKGGGRQ